MSFLLAILPILIPLLGAAVLHYAGRWPRIRPSIAVACILLTLLSLGFNTFRSNNLGFLVGQVSLVPDIDLRFDYTPATLLFSSLGLLAALSWLLAGNLRPDTRLNAPAFVTVAGVLAFVCADNWATLIGGWILAELGLLAWRIESRVDTESYTSAWRAAAQSLLGALAASAGAVALLATGSSLRLDDSALAGWAGSLILLAAWIRSGIFPFHMALVEHLWVGSGPEVLPVSSSLARPGTGHGLHPVLERPLVRAKTTIDDLYGVAFPMLMGLYLFVRSQLGTTGNLAHTDWIFLLSLFTLGASTLLTLFSEEGDIEQLWAILAIAASLWLIPFVGDRATRPALAVWSALGTWHLVVISIGFRLQRAHSSRQPWRRVLLVLIILCGAGFPLTAGFLARIGLYAAVLQGRLFPLLLLVPAVLTLALIPFWRAFMKVSVEQERKPTPIEYIGIVLLALPPLVEGLVPFNIMSLFGRRAEDASAFAYDALFHAPNPLQPILLLTLVLLPVPLAFYLARHADVWSNRVNAVPRAITSVLNLSAVSRMLVRVLDSGGVLLRTVSGLVEQHPVGWFLFAALWFALWFIGTR